MQRVLLVVATVAMLLPFPVTRQPSGHAIDSETQLIEAEDGGLTDNSVQTEGPDYSGSGHVGTFETDGSGVAVNVEVESTGPYNLVIIYAAYTETTNDIYVDDEQVDSAYFPPTLEFTERQPIEVWLESGSNTLEIRKNWGYFDIDAFEIELAAPRDPVGVDATLVNPDADSNARDLMQYLVDNYGTSTIS